MVELKSKRRMVSLRTTAAFVVVGLGISMFLSQTAAAADTDEALLFDPFTLRVMPRIISRIAPRIVSTGGAEPANTLRASGGSGGPVPMGYVPPPRIPYRPPLRSPFRPPI